jgi:hypothetical protein
MADQINWENLLKNPDMLREAGNTQSGYTTMFLTNADAEKYLAARGFSRDGLPKYADTYGAGNVYLDDLYDYIKANPGSAGAGGGAGMTGKTGTDVSRDSIEQYLLNNPRLAQQAWELTQQYMPQYAALARAEATKDRGADLGDVLSMMPQVKSIFEQNQRPEERAMRDLLFKQISGELEAGSNLTPELERQVGQYQRSAENARGSLAGGGAVNRESVAKALEGLNLLNQRQEKSKSLLSMEATQKPDPFMAVLGRPSASTNLAAQQSSNAQSTINPQFFSQDYFNAQNNNLNYLNFDRTSQWRQQMMDLFKQNPNLQGANITI